MMYYRILKVKEWLHEKRVNEDIVAYIRTVQEKMKERPIVDPKTGNILNKKYNPGFPLDEDYYIPVRAVA
jgi:hypothetical protein